MTQCPEKNILGTYSLCFKSFSSFKSRKYFLPNVYIFSLVSWVFFLRFWHVFADLAKKLQYKPQYFCNETTVASSISVKQKITFILCSDKVPWMTFECSKYSLNRYYLIKRIYDFAPQKHLLRGRCIHMYMEHKNHPDLRQTCRYEARKCQVSRNHHQSWRTESFSPFLRMWVRDGRSSPLLLQFGDQSWWGLTFFALLCFFSCF